jgi:2-oxoglutarate dehydrogenase E1 component
VFTPKSLLRLPQATSRLGDLASGTFQPVLDDPIADAASQKRVVLSTGKVYYDLLAGAEKMESGRPALVRLEKLYSFPEAELRQVLGRYSAGTEVIWCQEEPRNMGAWTFVEPRLQEVLPNGAALRYVGRPDRASPAEGYHDAHAKEQERIVTEARTG